MEQLTDQVVHMMICHVCYCYHPDGAQGDVSLDVSSVNMVSQLVRAVTANVFDVQSSCVSLQCPCLLVQLALPIHHGKMTVWQKDCRL